MQVFAQGRIAAAGIAAAVVFVVAGYPVHLLELPRKLFKEILFQFPRGGVAEVGNVAAQNQYVGGGFNGVVLQVAGIALHFQVQVRDVLEGQGKSI